MKRKRKIIVLFSIFLFPFLVQANAGTPLMWAGFFHLILGNLIIGIFEGLILSKTCGLPMKKCIWMLIVANYFSAWLGGVLLAGGLSRALPINLYNVRLFFWCMVVFAYLFTIIIEFPFVALAFRGQASWLRRSLYGNLIIQTASYLLLFGWYWMASGTSLITKTNIVDISAISLPEKVMVYFISRDDGDVYSGQLDKQDWHKIFDLNSKDNDDRLIVRPSTQNDNSWEIMARLKTDKIRSPKLIVVDENNKGMSVGSAPDINADPTQYDGTGYNFGRVPKLADAQTSSWEFRAGFWPIEGLHGADNNSERSAWLSLETPFFAWHVRNAIQFHGDLVLFQFGKDQICIYDPNGRKLALLASGRGPAIVEP